MADDDEPDTRRVGFLALASTLHGVDAPALVILLNIGNMDFNGSGLGKTSTDIHMCAIGPANGWSGYSCGTTSSGKIYTELFKSIKHVVMSIRIRYET